jgi:hypothetical protein
MVKQSSSPVKQEPFTGRNNQPKRVIFYKRREINTESHRKHTKNRRNGIDESDHENQTVRTHRKASPHLGVVLTEAQVRGFSDERTLKGTKKERESHTPVI